MYLLFSLVNLQKSTAAITAAEIKREKKIKIVCQKRERNGEFLDAFYEAKPALAFEAVFSLFYICI